MIERHTALEWAQRCPNLRPAGRGKWKGPCPLCGGVDRFHVETRADGNAIVGCRGCIDGEPHASRRVRFGELVREVWAGGGDTCALGRSPHRPSAKRAPIDVARSAANPNRAMPTRLWAAAIPESDPVRRYLAGRGVWPPWLALPDTVRWLPATELIATHAFEGLPSLSEMKGAMLCAFRPPGVDLTSAPVSVNVETLTNDGYQTRPRFRKDRGPKTGAAFVVRSGGTNGAGPIHVAEGEADALAIACWRRVEAWAAGGSTLMPKLALPLIRTGRTVVIEADGGVAGEYAAVALLEALASAGTNARIEWAMSGADPADTLAADWRAIHDERAAILEYEHGVSRIAAERSAADAAWNELGAAWFPPTPGTIDTGHACK